MVRNKTMTLDVVTENELGLNATYKLVLYFEQIEPVVEQEPEPEPEQVVLPTEEEEEVEVVQKFMTEETRIQIYIESALKPTDVGFEEIP